MSPMTDRFTFHSDPVRIVFGPGAIASLRGEADHHKMSRLMVLCSKSRQDFARRITAPVADRCVDILRRLGAQHAARGVRPHRRRHQAAQGRRLHRRRRRLADRARQGGGRDDQGALHRHRHHLFGLRDGVELAHRPGRQSHHRPRPRSAARDRDLRSRTDARSAARASRRRAA